MSRTLSRTITAAVLAALLLLWLCSQPWLLLAVLLAGSVGVLCWFTIDPPAPTGDPTPAQHGLLSVVGGQSPAAGWVTSFDDDTCRIIEALIQDDTEGSRWLLESACATGDDRIVTEAVALLWMRHRRHVRVAQATAVQSPVMDWGLLEHDLEWCSPMPRTQFLGWVAQKTASLPVGSRRQFLDLLRH